MLHIKARLAAVLGSALVAAALTLSPSPAMASASNCQAIHPDSLFMCESITGSGLFIKTMSAHASNTALYTVMNVHIELTGPKGHILNCAQVNIPDGGSTPTCTWSPNSNRAAGNYCAILWQKNSSTNYSELDHICIDVHT
jgi:hypothetical protein